MKTHSVRNNSDKTLRIITFTQPYMELLMSSNTNAVLIVLYNFKRILESITGKAHSYDYDQYTRLSDWHKDKLKASPDARYNRIHNLICDAIRVQNELTFNLVETLEDLSYIYNLMDKEYKNV